MVSLFLESFPSMTKFTKPKIFSLELFFNEEFKNLEKENKKCAGVILVAPGIQLDMNELKKEGKIQHIGLDNINIKELQKCIYLIMNL